MFNMENIGKNIAELRKENNMTQLELADLFSVTVDQLLGEHSEIIESAVNGDLKEYLENNSVTCEEICKIASFLDKNMLSEYVKEKYL